MKRDRNKKTTKFAQRALEDFSSLLFEELSHQSLESITVGELCQKANYPRSTFYNYFDDIKDLLNYGWGKMAEHIILDDFLSIPPKERAYVLFDRLYTDLDGHRGTIAKIMGHNPMDGRFVESLRRYLREETSRIIAATPCSKEHKLPSELIAEHYANTIQTMLEWCFLRPEKMGKAEAVQGLHELLEGLA